MTIHEELSLSVFYSRDDLSTDLVRALQLSLPQGAYLVNGFSISPRTSDASVRSR